MTVSTNDWLRAARWLRVSRGRHPRTRQDVVKATCRLCGAHYSHPSIHGMRAVMFRHLQRAHATSLTETSP